LKCFNVKVNIRLVLKGKDAAAFNAVKDKLGLVNNTDVLRLLIRRASEGEAERPGEVPAR